MFVSTYLYSIDEKGRLSIPAKFREYLEKAKLPEAFYLTKGTHGSLWGYPEDRFMEVASQWADRPANLEEQEFLRAFAAETELCPIDKQGRIIVPNGLREYAGISRDVCIVGMLKRIEIWDRAKYETHKQKNGIAPEQLLAKVQGPKPAI